MTSVTDTARRFLEDVPPEIRDVLDWYGDGDAKEAPSETFPASPTNSWAHCMRMGPLSATHFGFLPRRQ